MKNYNTQSPRHQEGAALAIGLIILVIITLMGYTGMKGTMLQEKMAAGLHNRSLANSGSHSALREGEKFLYNIIEESNGVQVTGTPGGNLFDIYSMYAAVGDPTSGPNPTVEAFKENDWSAPGGTETDFDFTSVTEQGAALCVRPEYVIQHVRDTTSGSLFGGAGGFVPGGTHEFGSGGGGGGGGGSGSSGGTTQDTYLITAKSRSGDCNSFSIAESVYTVVTSSSPTN